MGKHYYFEVDYKCTCEVCGNEIHGIMKRGPLEYGGGVLPTVMAVAIDAADMKLSQKLIESAVEGTGNQPYIAEKADTCPICGARQSWYPMAEPKKPGGIGGYIVAAVVGALIGMLVWGIAFFDAVIPFILCLAMGGGLGIFLVHLDRAKHGDEDAEMYDEMKKQYEEYIASLKTRTVKNKPEILWDTARRNPCDY